MKLLIGLGNPGKKYQATRHNIGYMIAESVAEELEIKLTKNKYSSLFGIGKIKDLDVCIVKPETFMNLSGEAVRAFAGFYKTLGCDILVVHDDMDMELGKLKFASKSGSGGHNGINSIIEQFGGNDFWRLKVGVGRPEGEQDPADYVLQNFAKSEAKILEKVIKTSKEAVLDFFISGPDKAMQKYHGSLIS